MRSLLATLFPRSVKDLRGVRRKGQRHQEQSGESLRGFDALESRAMLAVDVTLASNRVVLSLDAGGTTLSNLSTSYNSGSSLLTITAKGAGALSTSVPGITVNSVAETITVNLTKITQFAGLSVVGGASADAITIGPGGVNLAAVTNGAASQAFVIDTGAGLTDT
ncbi:MAG: hypothetical protein WCR51_10800, partial [Planctomycetia bacterium]